jgi:hypothetical protein
MKLEYIVVLLTIAAIGFGIWAWEMAYHRDFDVTFSASGKEMQMWAEKAKDDRWVEIVESKRIDGKLDLVPIPEDEIDAYINSRSSVLVRRWLEGDAGANILAGLASHGYPDAAGAAAEAAGSASSKKSTALWLAFIAFICGAAAVATASSLVRQRQRQS